MEGLGLRRRIRGEFAREVVCGWDDEGRRGVIGREGKGRVWEGGDDQEG